MHIELLSNWRIYIWDLMLGSQIHLACPMQYRIWPRTFSSDSKHHTRPILKVRHYFQICSNLVKFHGYLYSSLSVHFQACIEAGSVLCYFCILVKLRRLLRYFFSDYYCPTSYKIILSPLRFTSSTCFSHDRYCQLEETECCLSSSVRKALYGFSL